jgi:hypothetical protein
MIKGIDETGGQNVADKSTQQEPDTNQVAAEVKPKSLFAEGFSEGILYGGDPNKLLEETEKAVKFTLE